MSEYSVTDWPRIVRINGFKSANAHLRRRFHFPISWLIFGITIGRSALISAKQSSPSLDASLSSYGESRGRLASLLYSAEAPASITRVNPPVMHRGMGFPSSLSHQVTPDQRALCPRGESSLYDEFAKHTIKSRSCQNLYKSPDSSRVVYYLSQSSPCFTYASRSQSVGLRSPQLALESEVLL
jgi:hypothetical protein